MTFDLEIGYARPKNPLALAPMAGITDSEFAHEVPGAGMLVLGGYNADAATMQAARETIQRGRSEFIAEEPLEFIKAEIDKTRDLDAVIAVNVRSKSLEPLVELGEYTRETGAVLEINAHCRQPEMTRIGVGEPLLEDHDKMARWIREIKETGTLLSVKTRSGITDDVELARVMEDAGLDILHIDAMAPVGADVEVVRRTRDATDLFIIGNNSVTDFRSAMQMLSKGADMVSLARAVKKDQEVLVPIAEALEEYQKSMGWYNPPKHICSGGDLRGLAFCCMPVKNCPIQHKLDEIGMSPKEFAELKVELARDTPLEYGDSTCFDSLVWCCKATKPCFIRDGVLEELGVSKAEYMQLKHDLATGIVRRVRGEQG